MSTTFYGAEYELTSDKKFRAKCVYDISTSATAVTVTGTIYLQHIGGSATTVSLSLLAKVGITSTAPTTYSPGYHATTSLYAKTALVNMQNVGTHSSWTDVASQSFTLTVTKSTTGGTAYLLAGITSSGNQNTGYISYGQYKTFTVDALASYNVTYNANGGSGAPATQKKYYGQTLTLSSTKPTRTNYVFKNWNTASGGTGTTYNPGASYTSNAALTLYAQWYAPYTVTYNANGGTGGPTTQMKVYNTNLTLTTSQPTRSGYAFVKWNTASDGSGTSYNSGATYSANASVTLYAVWAAVPSISSLTAIRCDSNGDQDDEGTYANVTCVWSCAASASASGTYTPQSGGSATSFSFTSGASGSGTVTSTGIIGGGNLDTDMQYTVSVTISCTSSGTTKTASRNVILTRAFFVMDWKAGGGAVGIGRAAPASGLEVGYKTVFDDEVRSYGNVIIDKDEPVLNLRSNAQGGGYSGFSLRGYDTGSAGAGLNAVIQSGGNMIIGGGESPMTLYNNLGAGFLPSTTSEDMSIGSDQYIRLYPNLGNGLSEAGYVLIDSNGSIILRGKPFGSTPARASYYIDSPEFTIDTSAQNGITANKYMSLYFRDASYNWCGTVESQACYDSDSTAVNAGAVRTYIQSRNMKSDGTRVSNHFSVYTRKDGSLHYSCGSPANLRSDFDLAQKSAINLYSVGQGSSSDVSMANDTSVNLGTYTISTAGYYIIFAYFRFASNATGFRQGIISTTSAENAAPIDRSVMVQAANGWQTLINVAYAVNVTSSTKYYFVGKQKSGGALTGNVYWRIVRLK